MTKLPFIAATALIAAAGFAAAPALAAPSTGTIGTVPYCSSGSASTIDARKDTLSSELRLDTKPGSNISVWNGCLKVISTEDGQTTTAFYDPNTLQLIAEM